MKYIAFKRLKDHPLKEHFQNTLPDNYILEFSDFNKLVHKPELGFEIINEQDFLNEINKNKDLLIEFTREKLEIEQAHKKHMEEKEQLERSFNKQDFQLYVQFLDWKKNMEAESKRLKQLEIERLQRIQQGLGTSDDKHPIKWGNPLKQREQERKEKLKTQGIK